MIHGNCAEAAVAVMFSGFFTAVRRAHRADGAGF